LKAEWRRLMWCRCGSLRRANDSDWSLGTQASTFGNPKRGSRRTSLAVISSEVTWQPEIARLYSLACWTVMDAASSLIHWPPNQSRARCNGIAWRCWITLLRFADGSALSHYLAGATSAVMPTRHQSEVPFLDFPTRDNKCAHAGSANRFGPASPPPSRMRSTTQPVFACGLPVRIEIC